MADVNIPVGEVFTSPVLEKTTGTLFVGQVYLNGLNYENLEIRFKDGMVESYTCTNFKDEAENKKYIRDNVLKHHDTLPMGEFAIGTNTTAYRMARDYQIADKLPILIAEKTDRILQWVTPVTAMRRTIFPTIRMAKRLLQGRTVYLHREKSP